MNYRKSFLIPFIILASCFSYTFGQSHWTELPAIPDKEGFAGMYAGVSRNVLICAGGANFPDKKPWEGGAKQWYDQIYFLDATDGTWVISKNTLPRSLAYGISVSYNDQVILVGGNDSEKHYSDVFALEYKNDEIQIFEDFPSLPVPLSNMSGALVDGVIYVAGGNSAATEIARTSFYLLDLKTKKSEYQWQEGPTWPGPGRIQSVAGSHDGMFYLFSGFELKINGAGGIDRFLLEDAFRYKPGIDRPADGHWSRLPDMPRGVAAAPGPAFTVGMAHLVIPGGLDRQTLTFSDPVTHPGFSEEVTAFNVHSNEWVTMDPMLRELKGHSTDCPMAR